MGLARRFLDIDGPDICVKNSFLIGQTLSVSLNATCYCRLQSWPIHTLNLFRSHAEWSVNPASPQGFGLGVDEFLSVRTPGDAEDRRPRFGQAAGYPHPSSAPATALRCLPPENGRTPD